MFVRHFQHVYGCCNRPDISGGIVVCVRRVTATLAHELRLVAAIAFFAVTTFGTGTARISGVDAYDRDTEQLRLVLDEPAQLREAPSAHPGSLAFPEPCSRTNALEFFQGNSTLRVFGQLHDAFADAVINVSLEPGFLISRSSHGATCVLPRPSLELMRHSFSERPAPTGMALPSILDVFSAKLFSIACSGQIDDSQIHSNEVADFNRRVLWKIDRTQQIKLAIPVYQVALTLEPVESLPLIFTHDKRDQLATIQCQQTHAVESLERHQPLVISHSTVRLEHRAAFLVSRETFCRLADGPHGHLARQSKLLPEFVVTAGVDAGDAEHAIIKTSLGSVRCSRIERFHRSQKQLSLVGVRQQSDLQCEFHCESFGQNPSLVKMKGRHSSVA